MNTTSKLIKQLQEIHKEHGELPILTISSDQLSIFPDFIGDPKVWTVASVLFVVDENMSYIRDMFEHTNIDKDTIDENTKVIIL
jgi:hypothetical protein